MARRGRPRSFDRQQALRRAMEVFWAHGYEGASLSELTSAMGINSPSLYAAFGSKEQLFREAVRLYDATEGAATTRAMAEEPTARAAVEAMLRDNVEAYADPATPRGCMVVLAAATGAVASTEVQEFLAENRRQTLAVLGERIERGIHDGDLPPGTDAQGVAAFYVTILQGLSIQARDGASRARLHAVVDGAMAAWDTLTGGDRLRSGAKEVPARDPEHRG
ncbi:MAG TPA: TetR/AcrR family transcriptional regulator [Acidimicrobiales bacterium]